MPQLLGAHSTTVEHLHYALNQAVPTWREIWSSGSVKSWDAVQRYAPHLYCSPFVFTPDKFLVFARQVQRHLVLEYSLHSFKDRELYERLLIASINEDEAQFMEAFSTIVF